jgi:histidine ammonia-lyase
VTIATSPVEIGRRPTTVDDIVAIADGAPAALADEAVARMAAAREVVDDLVDGEALIYGLNTGLGHFRDQRMPAETLGLYQEAIVAAHAGGFGPALPTRVVRAAMAVRVAGLALGGAGASPAAAEQLVAMLERGIHPVVPSIGSVGAADLMHMAAIAQVAIGRGRAEVDGRIVDGAEALATAGLQPLALRPKDGLALISANGVSVGWAALLVDQAATLAGVADLAVALSLEATEGNPSIVEPVAAAAKPVPGQAVAAAHIRSLLAGSIRCSGAVRSVQDPLSFRVAPQVHGAYREFADLLRRATDTELSAMDDNPLVDVAERRIVSNGNFHPIALALSVDALRPAIAHVGQLSDRRMNHLWPLVLEHSAITDPAAVLSASQAGGGPLLRYAAATRAAELREIAGPSTLDVGPLDLGVEDHATNAVSAVHRTQQALDRLADVLSIEAILAWQIIAAAAGSGGAAGLGLGTGAAVDGLEAAVPPGPVRAVSQRFHAAVREALLGPVLAAADGATTQATSGRGPA